VDAVAVIKGIHLERLGKEFWTVSEALKEIRDVAARKLMQTFPFELKTREPSETAMKAVVAFSKKIGEYSALSPTDLKLLALTYMFESEINGIAHLKTEPQPRPLATTPQKSNENIEKGEDKAAGITENISNTPHVEGNIEEDKEKHESNNGIEEDNEDEEDPETNNNEASKIEGEDDGGEWITPDNVNEMKLKHGKELISNEPISVGCITADFAMQNVILQMGLKLVSFQGLVIKKTRNMVLNCFSCNLICKDTEKKFCPRCGNSTMMRVRMEVQDNGDVKYFPAQRITKRGSKYFIPYPKGGRNSGDIILTEDTYNEKNRIIPKKKDDFMDPDRVFGSKNKNAHRAELVVGYGKKNPNEAKHRIGKKNKTLSQYRI